LIILVLSIILKKEHGKQGFMNKLNVYLDTSIINFVTIEDSPEYRKATEVFFNEIVANGIIPQNKVADAFHIAYSTLFQMDILLCWNFHHLANIHKEQKVIILNKTLGFNYPFRMANPLEVYYEE
jgi:hypothetical protein